MNQVLLFNPRAMNAKPRIPNSILQIAASVDGDREWVIVDGNRVKDPWPMLEKHLASGRFKYFGMTVMPGPQLAQAIPYVRKTREQFPEIVNIWGGYFAANQHPTVLDSGWVDFVINGPGDKAFPALLDALENDTPLITIRNLIYKDKGEIVKTTREELLNLDKLNELPYGKLHQFHSMEGYLPKTWLGKSTIAYHSSFGCPFTCSFCAVVPIYNARWRGKSAQGIFDDIMLMKEKYGGDAIEFHDNNFFVARKRTVAFAELMRDKNMDWWGEGRIDTMDKYTDEDLALLRESGCRIIFFGAETGNDDILAQMDKGGTQTAAQIKEFAGRLRRFDIVPEYSFVLGMPADTPEQVMKQIDSDIAFIKEIKEVNPDAEIIIYVYSPVPTEGTELFEKVKASGFSFPERLEDWLDPVWEKFDLRKNPLTPWLTPAMVDKIRNFETVLNARYPTASDIKLSSLQRRVMRTLAGPRYRLGMYRFPYELKALQKFWLRYRRPETEGF